MYSILFTKIYKMGEEKRKSINIWDKVAQNFGKVGPKYWNYFGQRLVELSSIDSGKVVLDIGMGRGSSLFSAISEVGKYGYVIGIDNSEGMVSETHKEILSRNIDNAEVKNMNAQSLEFHDDSFDNVICGFGIGYLLLNECKLNEVIRVLKNNGQAGFSIWGEQQDQKWLTEVINKYLQSENNNEKLDIPKFDTANDVTKILRGSGFSNIKVCEETLDVVYKDKEEWWQEMNTNAVRGIFEQIERLGSDIFRKFKSDIFSELENFDRGDGFHFNMPVIYAFGEK